MKHVPASFHPSRWPGLIAWALVALIATAAPPPSAAQTGAAPKTREQVRKETADFLKTHQWDETKGVWLPEDNLPPGTSPTRAKVREELMVFLRNHRWDDNRARWVPLKPQPRRLSTLTREQVRAETEAFLRTHHWDEQQEAWVENPPRTKGKP